MQNNSRARRQQLRPHGQIQLSFQIDVKFEEPPDNDPHAERRGELTRPRHRRGVKGEVEVVGLVGVVEGEVRVDVFVHAEVEDEDGAEEGGHGDVLGNKADEDVADAELLVGGVGECADADDGEDAVEDGGHEGGVENDKAGA